MVHTLLNVVYSASYNTFLKNMNQQLANIATGISNLPSNIAESLANQ
jgi:hypothetical protein